MYQLWLKLGLDKGITDLEIYAVKNRSLKLSVYQNKLDQHSVIILMHSRINVHNVLNVLRHETYNM